MTSLLFAITPVNSNSTPILPQSVYELVIPFFCAVVLSGLAAPVYALFLRLGLSLVGEPTMGYWQACQLGYLASVLQAFIFIPLYNLDCKILWPFLAIPATAALLAKLIPLRYPRAILLTVAPIAVVWGGALLLAQFL